MSDLVPPLFRRCGGTFPRGKVRKRHRREAAFPHGEGEETPPPEVAFPYGEGKGPPPEVAFPYGEGGRAKGPDG